jgi:hypothetical protein
LCLYAVFFGLGLESMGIAEQLVWRANLFLTLVLILRLFVKRLHRIYFWFFLLLCFQAFQTLGMMPLDPARNLYAWAYFLTQPALWVFYMLAVLELYALVLRKHQGLASLSRWFMLGALLVSVGVSALTMMVDSSRPGEKYPILVYFSVFERCAALSLVLFLLLITGFLIWTPISIRRNIVVHASLYSGYFLATAAALFLRNIVGEKLIEVASIFVLSLNTACLLLWILLLNERGENIVMMVRSKWQAVDEIRLTHQLDAVNSFLMKPSNK